VNVRLVLHDESEVSVDTVYVGVIDGQHTWHVVTGPPLEQVKSLKIEKLPPATSVSIGQGYADV